MAPHTFWASGVVVTPSTTLPLAHGSNWCGELPFVRMRLHSQRLRRLLQFVYQHLHLVSVERSPVPRGIERRFRDIF